MCLKQTQIISQFYIGLKGVLLKLIYEDNSLWLSYKEKSYNNSLCNYKISRSAFLFFFFFFFFCSRKLLLLSTKNLKIRNQNPSCDNLLLPLFSSSNFFNQSSFNHQQLVWLLSNVKARSHGSYRCCSSALFKCPIPIIREISYHSQVELHPKLR